MKNKLLFDFSINKENRTALVEREFAADLPTVWKAWTRAEILDRWWAPKPWKAETKSMDFSEGGHWLYAMVGPEGERHWGRADYLSIQPEKSFNLKDSFCDENGTIDTEAPQSNWESRFTTRDDLTHVHITLRFKNTDDLEKLVETGFKEGFTASMDNLDALLSNLKI